MDCNVLRDLFLKRLTVDSNHSDRRKADYNQAIFDADEGWACFNETDLDMVMEKFDQAVKDYLKPKTVTWQSEMKKQFEDSLGL